MDLLALRVLVAVVSFGFMAHRIYFLRTVRHRPDAIAERPPEAFESVKGSLLIVAAVATAVYLAAPAWTRWASLPLPAWLRWAALGLTIPGFALLQWAQETLGRNWSAAHVELLKDHQLVRSGPYRWVRHPMYTSALLIHTSVLLLSANWLVGGLWLGTNAWQFASRIPIEEGLMVRQFGDEYRAYARTTGRLIPRIFRRA